MITEKGFQFKFYRGSFPTLLELTTLVSVGTDGDFAFVANIAGAPSLYAWGNGAWGEVSGGSETPDHNSLTGRTNSDSHPATAISYDNSTSGLTADEVQAAIDEVATSSGGGGMAANLLTARNLYGGF